MFWFMLYKMKSQNRAKEDLALLRHSGRQRSKCVRVGEGTDGASQ